ncbi:leucyl aminopeptidase family protein [Thiotrichales bacterium 19S9-12]|nr:leucyl aminopeptidase family protein [Thiotrichales bacterium 19S9-11]MCF6812448.1 leucyl aminopeptidase family protein [Thiotrichales bacterium 19S9-12]
MSINLPIFTLKKEQNSIPIILVNHQFFDQLSNRITETEVNYVKSVSFKANPQQHVAIPDENGNIKLVLWGVEGLSQLDLLGYLGRRLPKHAYYIEDLFNLIESWDLAFLGYALGSYQFNQYKSGVNTDCVKLYWPDKLDQNLVKQVEAVYLVRDLINIPANDLSPEILSQKAEVLAKKYNASFKAIEGGELLKENYPLVHAVGRASKSKPCMVKMTWGDSSHPHIALVGKGVCFDTGGLSLKPTAGMKLMKKDMGGAAQTLGLMQLIMAYQLPVYVTAYIPMVENAVGGDALRVGDIVKARNGKQVEVLNTDAEGRLILADALAEAAESDAELILDFATLTGACRIALGMDIGAIYSNDDVIAKAIEAHSEITEDWLWHMPLFKAYRNALKSTHGEIANVGSSPYAGSITAALFLEEFVNNKPWVHFDISGWKTSSQATGPVGGEAIGLRAVFQYLTSRYA